MTSDAAKTLQRGIRRLRNTTVVLVVTLGLVIGWVAFDSARTHSALCTFRDDLTHRVQASLDFLAEHPHGVSGISAATIQTNIANQQRTVAALAALRC